MDYIDGIPALQTGDPLSLVPQYTQELRDQLSPAQGTVTAEPGFSGSPACHRIPGDLVIFNGELTVTTEVQAGTSWIALCQIPAGFRPPINLDFLISGSASDAALRTRIYTSGTVYIRRAVAGISVTLQVGDAITLAQLGPYQA